MRLIRWLLTLAVLAIVVWFATMVPLGPKTLWQHLRAIAATREAHELAEGTKQEARKVAERVREGAPSPQAAGDGRPDLGVVPPGDKGPPLEQVDEHDRQGLNDLVRGKTGPAKGEGAKAQPGR